MKLLGKGVDRYSLGGACRYSAAEAVEALKPARRAEELKIGALRSIAEVPPPPEPAGFRFRPKKRK